MIKSSPYYSRANGKAESAVKIAKNILKKSRHEDPYLVLLAYRNTPQQGCSYSPAQRLMSRRLITASYLLLRADLFRRQRCQVWYSKTLQIGDEKQRRSTMTASAPLIEFSKGEKVYVKPRPTNRQQPWIFGEVIGKPAPRARVVNTHMGPVRRNHAQIREAKMPNHLTVVTALKVHLYPRKVDQKSKSIRRRPRH